MTSLINVTDKTGYFTSRLEDAYNSLTSPLHHSDLVLLCADCVEVSLHQAVMVNLSPMLREVLDHMDYSNHEYPLLIMFEQESTIARKMVELIYTGKSTIGNQKDFLSLQNLLSSLWISLDIFKITEAPVEDTEAANVIKDRKEIEKEREKALSKKFKSRGIQKTILKLGDSPTDKKRIKRKGVIEERGERLNTRQDREESIGDSNIQANVLLKMADQRVSIREGMKGRHGGTSRCSSYSPVDKSDAKVAEDSKMANSDYLCPVCNEAVRFKAKNRLIKHMVDDHYYEDLETLLVKDFSQSPVCCKIDFNNSGFGMFIRHKAEKHRAVQKVSTKEVRECLDRDCRDFSSGNLVKKELSEAKGKDDTDEVDEITDNVDSDKNPSNTVSDVTKNERIVQRFLSFKSFASLKSDNIVENMNITL